MVLARKFPFPNEVKRSEIKRERFRTTKKGLEFHARARDPVYSCRCNYVCCAMSGGGGGGPRAFSPFSYNFEIVRRNDMNQQPYQRKPICQVNIMRSDNFHSNHSICITNYSCIRNALSGLGMGRREREGLVVGQKRQKRQKQQSLPTDSVHAKEFQIFQRVNVAWPTGMCG